MRTIFLQALWESLHRRVALAMLVVAILTAGMMCTASFQGQPGQLYVESGRAHVPAAGYVNDRFTAVLGITSGPWIILSLFAVAPLLTSHLEKGWAELLFAKGVARWQVVTARVAGALAVFVLLLVILAIVPCGYLAWRASVPFRPFLAAMALITFNFVAYLAMMLLVSSTQPNSALLIGVGFVQTLLSAALMERQRVLYGVITWKGARWLIDWTYRILPKDAELSRQATWYLSKQTWLGWWPVWTTGVFVAVSAGWALWRFERKAL